MEIKMKPTFKKLIITSLIISHILPITPSYADAQMKEMIKFDDSWNIQTTKVGDSTPLYFNSNGDLKVATPGMVSSSMTQLANAFNLPSIKNYISNWQSVALSVAIYSLQSYFPSVKEAISSANYMANEAGKTGNSIYKDTLDLAHLSGKPVGITQACVVAKLGLNPFTANTDSIQNAIGNYIASNGHDAYQKLVSECSINGNLKTLIGSASIQDLRKFLDNKSLRKVIDAIFTQKFKITDNGINYTLNSSVIKNIVQSGDADKVGELLVLANTPETTIDDNGNLVLKEMKDENGNVITPDWIDKQITLGIHDDLVNNVFTPLEQSASGKPMPIDIFLNNVKQVYSKYGIQLNTTQSNDGSMVFNDDMMVKVYMQWFRYYDMQKYVNKLKAQNNDHSKDGEIIEKQKIASQLYSLYTDSRDAAINVIVNEFNKKVIDSAYTYMNRAKIKAEEMEKQSAKSSQDNQQNNR
jgi:hypothetical protein